MILRYGDLLPLIARGILDAALKVMRGGGQVIVVAKVDHHVAFSR